MTSEDFYKMSLSLDYESIKSYSAKRMQVRPQASFNTETEQANDQHIQHKPMGTTNELDLSSGRTGNYF